MSAHSPIRIAVLLSGSGTTLQNLIDCIATGRLDAQIGIVVSSKPSAYGVERARSAGLPTEVVDRKVYESAESFSEAIFALCRDAKVDLVCLAGFLQRLAIPSDFHWKVLNIHPSLLPAFGGKGMYGHHVHQAVIDYGAKITGCTVHFVDQEFDHGPIVLQRAVNVHDDDTHDMLAARVFAEECEAYPEAIRLVAEGQLRIEGRRVCQRGS